MAKGVKGYKKGESGNLKGKPLGAQNRTTKEAKEILDNVMYGEIDHIKAALFEIRKKDPTKYIDSVAKLFNFVLPKKSETDITTGGEQITINIVKGGKH